jgi:hypothetical protein
MIKSTATFALAYIAEAAALKEMLAQLDSEQVFDQTQQLVDPALGYGLADGEGASDRFFGAGFGCGPANFGCGPP